MTKWSGLFSLSIFSVEITEWGLEIWFQQTHAMLWSCSIENWISAKFSVIVIDLIKFYLYNTISAFKSIATINVIKGAADNLAQRCE